MNKIIFSLMTTALAIEETILVTGTVALLNDISKALLIIAPSVGIVTLGILAIMKTQAEENEQPMYKKRMVGVAIAVIIVFVASGLITAITSYYK